MNSIRLRLTIWLLLLFVVLLGTGLLVLFVVARNGTIEEFDDALRAKALAVSKLIVETPQGIQTNEAAFFLGVGDVLRARAAAGSSAAGSDSYERFLNGFRWQGRHNYFELWDTDGRRLAKSDTLLDVELPHRGGRVDQPRTWDFLVKDEPARAVEFTFHPEFRGVPPPERRPQEVQLVVAAEREALDEKLLRLELLTMVCGVLLLGATLGVVPVVLKRALRPLQRLGNDVARVDASSLAARFSKDQAPAELYPIVDGLNGFMARLQQSFERERRFSADLAHELRTPLSELRGLAECALKWPETRGASLDRDTLAIARQMESMVEKMLALARSEQGLMAAQLESIDAGALVDETWRHFAPRAEARRLKVTLRLSPGLTIADAALLRSVLGVALENAVNYTPVGEAITIESVVVGGQCVIQVTNQTSDLEADDIGKLFDRFWRKETARSGGMHLGLGLSLAKTHAAAMGWDIRASLDERRRMQLTLTGPASGSSVAKGNLVLAGDES